MRASVRWVKLVVLTSNTLTASSFGHIINAPIAWVDLADWLRNLTSSEYRRLSPEAHVAAGRSPSGGEPISIQVEMIGENLLVHQYVGELIGCRSCRMASVSDVFTALGQTTVRVLWELGVEPLDEQSCEYVNCLTAITTNEFHSFIHARGISLEAAATDYTEAFEAHLALETASLAASIERRARASGEI